MRFSFPPATAEEFRNENFHIIKKLSFIESPTMKKTFTLLLLLFFISSCSDKPDEEVKIKHSNPPDNPGSTTSDKNKISDTVDFTGSIKPAEVISPFEAKDHVGEKTYVRGYVADVYRSKKAIFLNFEKKYPKNPFTGVIFERSFDKIDNPEKYEGEKVKIRGKISMYKGKPQIIIEGEDQLEILN